MLTDCDICKSSQLKKIRSYGDKIIYRCSSCGIVSFYPKSSLVEVNINNNKRYDYSKEAEKAYLNKEKELRRRALICSNNIKKFIIGGKLLDIGCSYGFYLDVFRAQGFNVIGIEPTPSSIEYAKKKLQLNVYKTTFEKYKSREKFDCVLLIDVIEHFSDPISQLEKVKKILKPGGIVFIQTPNFDSFISKLTKNKWFWLLIPEHLHLYTKKSLIKQVEAMGFETLRINTWDDMSEFIKNMLMIMYLKDKGKTKIFYYFFYNFFQVIYPMVHIIIDLFGTGGEISMYAKAKI